MQPTAVQPDVSQRRNDFEAIWRNALKQARETLGEDDFEYVQDFTNAEQLLAEVQSLEKKCLSTKVPRMLISVKPHLGHLQYFATYLTAIIGSSLIRTACVWGATSLLLRVSPSLPLRYVGDLTFRSSSLAQMTMLQRESPNI